MSRALKRKAAKKTKAAVPKAERKSHAAQVVAGGITPAEKPKMSDDELQYRMLLQEALLFITKQILEEQRAEILKRAEERVLVLRELRG